MAKKTKIKKQPKKKKADVVEIVPEIVQEPEAAPEEPQPKSSKIMLLAILLVIAVVIAIAAYVILFPYHSFVPGNPVDSQTFLDLFQQEDNIVIFMDVRGVSDTKTRQNIFQCGIDFAGSSGMGPKNTTYFSMGDAEKGCVTPEGIKEEQYCFDSLKDAITIYVQKGDTTSYYNNGVVVGVNETYPVGLCGIHMLN
ncbi:hypothetical protein JXA56_04100 [Candidatus Micrarchaeota archaeon]|nr:hypothetical protein [Candidatus Micrarchaeota archaeon]